MIGDELKYYVINMLMFNGIHPFVITHDDYYIYHFLWYGEISQDRFRSMIPGVNLQLRCFTLPNKELSAYDLIVYRKDIYLY